MESESKRKLLKAGAALLSGTMIPIAGRTALPPSVDLLSILRSRYWLTAEPPFAEAPAEAPVLPRTMPALPESALVHWVNINLDLVRKYRLNPLRAARTFSYLTVAAHDAILRCVKTGIGSPRACNAALHLAAGSVLEHLFPEEARSKWQGHGMLLAASEAPWTSKEWNDLWVLSQRVALLAINRALTDGSARINALAQPPKQIASPWKAAPPLWSTRPVEPGAGKWKEWLVPSSIGDACPAPPSGNAEKYLQAIVEVYRTHQHLTANQKKIAEDWNLELGTVTPPGVWLLNTMQTPAFSRLSLIDQASVLSLLTTTMLDAFGACRHVKFTWWSERPITAIRRMYDPNFLPSVLTPSFPSYPSGHATVSGAAAAILCCLFPENRDEWQRSAHEAAESRLYGGIHFRFDNDEGLHLGEKVAEHGIANLETTA